MATFLNIFFFVFHSLWMLFNSIGWIWKRTRPWHLLTVFLTAFSWFFFAWWFGYDWGYCLCTDWHWQARAKLGYPHDPSYTHLLILTVTGLDVPPWVADTATVGVFALVTVLTLVLNTRDFLRWRRRQRPIAP